MLLCVALPCVLPLNCLRRCCSAVWSASGLQDILMDLEIVPDVIGLTGRRPEAAVCRIIQGRDVQSVRVLVPDYRGLS